jgi:hypothetical protein
MSQEAQGFSLVLLFLQAGQQVLPLGGRNKSGAASEQARLRWALPIFWPDVPRRLPPDSWLHLTRRPYEANSCTLGNRSIWWMS